jgi:hypothetical protein
MSNDIIDISFEDGILLKEFSAGNKRPSVYLIWERQIGSIEKVGLCCICSTKEQADRRVRGLNNRSFWDGTDLERPTIYSLEECEIDHLFAASMMTYDIDLDTTNEQMTRSSIGRFIAIDLVEDIRRRASVKITELNSIITDLKEQLATSGGKIDDI